MLAGNALRHQMILPEQQAVYDYWRSKCKAGSLPSRSDIDPSDLAEYLPTIALLELSSVVENKLFNFRLAGTGRYDIAGSIGSAFWNALLCEAVRPLAQCAQRLAAKRIWRNFGYGYHLPLMAAMSL